MRFNIRVYGLLIEKKHILVSDENKFGYQFTKFPGGGLEFKEGISDCLKREFSEELGIRIEVNELFHINEDYVPSAFNIEDQIISIYYLVQCENPNKIQTVKKKFDFKDKEEVHRWIKISELNKDDFRFPIDKMVISKLQLHS